MTMDGRKKREKIRRLNENLDMLIGSVIVNYLKCGKNCVCNKGKKHRKYYLSSKEGGKTTMLYLPPGAVEEAEQMSRRYKKVKTILQEISRINYGALKERHLAKGR